MLDSISGLIKKHWGSLATVICFVIVGLAVFAIASALRENTLERNAKFDKTVEVKAVVKHDGNDVCIVEVDGEDYRAYARNTGVCLNHVGDIVKIEAGSYIGDVNIVGKGK